MWYKRKEELDPSKFWGMMVKKASATIQGIPNFQPYADNEAYTDALLNFSEFYGDVDSLFLQNVGKNIHGFDSLYIDRDGNFALLKPHTHDATAREILRSVYPELPARKEDGKYKKGGGYTHADLTALSGIQRAQIYNDGMGVTVEMNNPPTPKQLYAIKDAYQMTTMNRFVAEIMWNGERIAHVDSFDKFVYFVNNFDPNDPNNVDEIKQQVSKMVR